jgi:hypothetical protein
MKKRTAVIVSSFMGIVAATSIFGFAFSSWISCKNAEGSQSVAVEVNQGFTAGTLTVNPSPLKMIVNYGENPHFEDAAGVKQVAMTLEMECENPKGVGTLYWSLETTNSASAVFAATSAFSYGQFVLDSQGKFSALVPLPSMTWAQGNPANASAYSSLTSGLNGKLIEFKITTSQKDLSVKKTATPDYVADGVSYVYADNAKTQLKAISYSGTASELAIPASYNSLPIVDVADSAFMNAKSLKKVSFANPSTVIENCAFEGCSALEELTLPSAIGYLGHCCFVGCESLKTVSIPDSCETIGSGAFANCRALADVEGMKGLQHIYCGAFAGDVKITSFVFPSTLTVMKCTLFEGCTGLTSLNYEGTMAQWNAVGKYESNGVADADAWRRGSSLTQVVCSDGAIALA